MSQQRSALFLVIVTLVISMLASCSGRQQAGAKSLPEDEPVPGARRLLHYPPDNHTLGVNPPGFTWSAHEAASSYSLVLESEETGERVSMPGSIEETVALPGSPLAAGHYRWHVEYLGSSGEPFARSAERHFTVGAGTPVLTMPDIRDLESGLAGRHPRFFLRDSDIEKVRANAEGPKSDAWRYCRAMADAALSEPLYPEPAPYKDGEFEVGEWRRIYTPGKRGSAHAARLALAWKLTGEEKYLEGAKKWLLHLSTWDPDGITSYNLDLEDGSTGNDEAGMPILERMALAYDWTAGELSAPEKEKILACLRARGEQVMDHYRDVGFISNPWSNHDVRVLGFLGLAGLACLGDVPEAAGWLDYVLRCYLTSFPTWGSDDGGWAQGLSYWSAYMGWHANFLDALVQATGMPIYRKPFLRNNGYFAVYFHPPYAKRGGFGDHGESAPSSQEKLLIAKYAAAHNDPVLLWQAENIEVSERLVDKLQVVPEEIDWREWFVEDMYSVLTFMPEGLEPQPPSGMPGSKHLTDIGWVGMHSALGDAENDVWALFKSSRYGSFSHSHADQNSFQLNAWGEPLIIDSGYYPWFGSPHHNLWTRQTRAHNAVLVNGRGQASSSMEASGTIEHFEHKGVFTVAAGECGRAYNVPMNSLTESQWKEWLDEPLPPDGPPVLTARRTLAFCGAGERSWLGVLDYLETGSPTVFQFLLHSLEEMEIDSDRAKVTVRRGDVLADVYIISSAGELEISQNGKFPVPPGERYEGAAEQWHLSAATTVPENRVRFLAVLVPYRAGEEPPAVSMLREGDTRGFRVGRDRLIAWWGERETGDMAAWGGSAGSRLVAAHAGEVANY